MTSSEDEVPEAPATWENVVVGEAKEVLGHLVRKEDLVEEGHEQVDAAHEAREKYKEEHD